MPAKKVLVATDFSPPSKQLLGCLLEFRCVGVEEIVLIHVVDIRTAGLSTSAFHYYDEEQMEEESARLTKEGFKVSTLVPVGVPAPEIVHTARDVGAESIVIASHGEGFIRQVFLGSTVYDVLRLSSVPVYLEKFHEVDSENCTPVCSRRLQRVAVPVDFSPCSHAGIETVRSWGNMVGEVVLVAVIERSRNMQELERQRLMTTEKLTAIGRELEQGGVPVRIHVEAGTPSRHIISVVKEEEATLLVVPRRGGGFIRELLLGSTAEALARRSPVPVFLVPCKKWEKEMRK